MTRPSLNSFSRLEADQLSISVINMLVLTTYTDQPNGTVDKIFYFGDRDFVYDYDGTDRYFQAFLQNIDPVEENMGHIPSRTDFTALHRSASFSLRNGPWNATQCLCSVLSAVNMIRAKVEISQLLRAENVEDRVQGDKVVWFRGEIVAAPRMTQNEMFFECESLRLKEFSYEALRNPGVNDPHDVGLKVPWLFGNVVKHRALGWDVPQASTLAQEMTGISLSLYLSDASAFPSSGSVRIDREQIAYTGKTGNQLTGITRGSAGTTASPHVLGAIVNEIPASDVTWIIADHEMASVDEVFVVNPIVNALFRVETTALYTINLANTTLIPGKTVATLTQAPNQYISILDQLASDAATVTTQPDIGADATYTTDAGAGVVLARPTARSFTNGNPDSDRQNVALLDNGVSHTGISGISTNYYESRWQWQAGDGLDATRDVKRWRLRVGGNGTAGTDDGECWVRVVGVSGFTSTTSIKMWEIAGGTSVNGKAGVTSWRTPAAGTKASSLIGNYVRLWIADQNTSQNVEFDCYFPFDAVWMEIEYDTATVTLNTGATVTNAVVGGGAGFGYNLEWRTTGVGVKQPADSDPSWIGTNMEKIVNELNYVIRVQGGGALASAWNTLLSTQMFDLTVNFSLWEQGDDIETVIQNIAYECATNIVQEEGPNDTEYRWLCPNKDGTWDGTGAKEITQWQDFEQAVPPIEGRYTEWRSLFGINRFIGDIIEDAFEEANVVNPDGSTIAAITTTFMQDQEKKYGLREAPHALLMLYPAGDSQNDNVLAYWIKEATRDMKTFVMTGVPWVQAMDLVRGDLVRVQPPWVAPQELCRVTAYRKDFISQLADITVVTVTESP